MIKKSTFTATVSSRILPKREKKKKKKKKKTKQNTKRRRRRSFNESKHSFSRYSVEIM